MTKDISQYVYEPVEYEKQLGYRRNAEWCAAGVPKEHWVGDRQCMRKPKEEIQGYKFCAQHAKLIKNHLAEA